MTCYLKHFTAVGDNHERITQTFKEDLHEVVDERASRPPQGLITFQQSLRRLFASERFQVTVVCLVVLDALFVLIELLMDLSIIKTDHEKIAPQVFHYLSLALLTFFMVELSGKIYAYRCEFFKHKFEVFDGVVVIISFILDIVYMYSEDAFDGVGLLILLRLWRVARIINGIIVSVENRSHHKILKLNEANDHLTQQVSDLQTQNSRLGQENHRLRELLKLHEINF